MARARVELTGSMTHNGNGRSFKRGSPQVITSIADIRYYKGQSSFKVIMLNEAKVKKPIAPKAPPAEEPAAEEEETEEEDVKLWSRKELEAKRKAVLVEIADKLEAITEEGAKKVEIIQAILDAQAGEEEEEEEEEEE